MTWLQRHLKTREAGCPTCGASKGSCDTCSPLKYHGEDMVGKNPYMKSNPLTPYTKLKKAMDSAQENFNKMGGGGSPLEKRKSKEPRKTTKGKGRNFRTTKEGAGMTEKGVREYRRKNPGSKLKTAVTGKVKPGSKAAKRRKSFCARSKNWKGPRGRAARRRWRC